MSGRWCGWDVERTRANAFGGAQRVFFSGGRDELICFFCRRQDVSGLTAVRPDMFQGSGVWSTTFGACLRHMDGIVGCGRLGL